VHQAIRILLVDEHEPVRYGLQRMLEQEEDMKVVGDYASAEEASSELARLQPDIVLMDAQMPGMNGIEAARYLKKGGLSCNAGVILVTEGRSCRAGALEAGIVDSLVKDWACTEITGVIREVYRNKQMRVGLSEYNGETVELVTSPSAESASLLKFLCWMESILGDHSGSILRVAGSWACGMVITLELRFITMAGLCEKLAGMAGVEVEDEELLAAGNLSSLPGKFGSLARPGTSHSRRLRVILRENGIAGKTLASVMN